MKISIEKFKKFIEEFFDNNQSKCAKELGITREYINKLLIEGKDIDSSKLCLSLITYCKKHNLNEKDYIFLS